MENPSTKKQNIIARNPIHKPIYRLIQSNHNAFIVSPSTELYAKRKRPNGMKRNITLKQLYMILSKTSNCIKPGRKGIKQISGERKVNDLQALESATLGASAASYSHKLGTTKIMLAS